MTTLAGRVAVLFASLGFLLVHTSALAQEPSLAEQVAAAKSRSGHEQPTRVMGRTVAGDYQNGALGFQLRHIPGWTSMSRGMMNVDEAMGREALGLQAGLDPSSNRVFGMHNEDGDNVMVAIVALPAGTNVDPVAIKLGMVQIAKSQLPNAKIADESILLGDSTHRFTGFRLTHDIANREIFQSMQILPLNGYALSITRPQHPQRSCNPSFRNFEPLCSG